MGLRTGHSSVLGLDNIHSECLSSFYRFVAPVA